jgi:hypothetical protein
MNATQAGLSYLSECPPRFKAARSLRIDSFDAGSNDELCKGRPESCALL